MSSYIVKPIYLGNPKQLIIWDRGSKSKHHRNTSIKPTIPIILLYNSNHQKNRTQAEKCSTPRILKHCAIKLKQ